MRKNHSTTTTMEVPAQGSGGAAPSATERRFRALIEHSSDMKALIDSQGNFLYASPSTTRILGYSLEEYVGRNAFDFVHPEDRKRTQDLLAALVQKPGATITAEYRMLAKDGTWRWIEGSGTNLLADPDIRAVVANYHDITERKRAEAERQVIFEIIHALNFTANLDELLHLIHQALKKVLYAENCFVALYDHGTGMFHFPFVVDQFDEAPPPQKVGRSCTAYVFRTGHPMLIPQKLFDQLAVRGEVELVGTPSPTWLGVPLRTPSETIGVLVVQHYEDENVYTERDLEFLASVGGQIALAIERRRADEALRKQQEEQGIIFHSAPAMIWYKDTENRILRANKAAAESVGFSIEQMEGKFVHEFSPEYAAEYYQDDLEVIRTGVPMLGVVQQYVTAAGERRWGRADKIPYRDHAGNIIGVIIFATDITEQQRAGDAMRRSEANYRSLVEGAPYGIYRVQPDGKLLDVNSALVEMLGYGSKEELLAMDMDRDIYRDPEERARLAEHYPDRLEGVEVAWERKDGAPIAVRLSGRPVYGPEGGVICHERIAENVTERRALEMKLSKAQKMEAVGRLAGGVAHDFNNLLMVIKGHTELLLERIAKEDSFGRKVEQIQRAADRAAALTRQLLAFSRMQVLQPKVIDLNGVVAEMGKMLPRVIGEDIELSMRTDPQLAHVKADPTQIEQVILNLAVNARDAMPKGGKLVIETSNAELDEAYARRHPPLIAGRYTLLAVSDTGMGMDAETQAHIFEPFFTTKEKGKGTGLGLATVYGVVKQSGGYIWVYSEIGQGTTFKIYLPRVDEAADPARPAKSAAQAPAGTETILLAEDERDVREIAREFLDLSGYTVLEAKDGAEALDIAARHEGPIHLLVTDMVMPGMGGRELAARLTTLRPGLKVVYMSGYTEYTSPHAGETDHRGVLLTKPFTRTTLSRMVRDALESAKAR